MKVKSSVGNKIISVMKIICLHGLAFRGKNQLIGSSNNGNFLGILELLSEYDKFLVEHISKHSNKGRGHTTYLSSTICEEMIELMGQKVLSVIVDEIQTSTSQYLLTNENQPQDSRLEAEGFLKKLQQQEVAILNSGTHFKKGFRKIVKPSKKVDCL